MGAFPFLELSCVAEKYRCMIDAQLRRGTIAATQRVAGLQALVSLFDMGRDCIPLFSFASLRSCQRDIAYDLLRDT